jgi:hypothetical protein
LVVSQSITSNNIVSNTLTSNVIVSDTITIIQGVDVGQNTRLTVIEGTNTSQNARMTIIEGTDASQNVRLDYSNTVITVIQGTDVTQNTRLTVAEGVDASQNVRLDYSNTAITAIQAVDVTQNINISNKVDLTGSPNQTVSGNVTISQSLVVSNTITSNVINVTQSNVINLFVTQANVANLTLVSNGTFQLGQVNYLDATNTRLSYQPNLTKIALLTNADLDLGGTTTSADSLGIARLLAGTFGPSSYLGWQPSLQLANNKTTGISFFKSAFVDQSVGAQSEGFLTLTSGNVNLDKITNYIRVGQYVSAFSGYSTPSIVLKPNTSSPWTAGVGIGEPGDTGISSNSNTSGSLVVYGGVGVSGNVYSSGIVSANIIVANTIYAGEGLNPMQLSASSYRNYVSGFTRSYLDSNALTLGLQNLPMDSSTANTNGGLLVYGGAGITGNVYTGGVISPGKGLVYLPLVYPGAQTAITLDFANNSLVRANASSGVVASFSNLTAGKTVDLWITNTSGGTIVFTHGCSSLKSTVGSTTYTIPATSSIRASYVSFGTDVANTFVAITK